MSGFSLGQGVPLHRGLHQLGASTNSNQMLYRLIRAYSRVHRPPSAAEFICFRTLAVAYIPLQLTKSLSIVSLHLIWTELLLAALIIYRVKAAQARLYPGILWSGPIYTPGYKLA